MHCTDGLGCCSRLATIPIFCMVVIVYRACTRWPCSGQWSVVNQWESRRDNKMSELQQKWQINLIKSLRN